MLRSPAPRLICLCVEERKIDRVQPRLLRTHRITKLWKQFTKSWVALGAGRAFARGLRRVAVLLLQELGEHAVRIDLDERSRAGGQHFPFGVADLGGSKMLAAIHADFPAFRDQRLDSGTGRM